MKVPNQSPFAWVGKDPALVPVGSGKPPSGLPVVEAPVQTAAAVGVAAGGGNRLPEEPEAEGALQVLGLHHHCRAHGARFLHPGAGHQVPATMHIHNIRCRIFRGDLKENTMEKKK